MISGLKPSARGEYELSDALQALIDNNYSVKASKIDGWRLDIGYPEDLLSVNKHFLTAKTHNILGDVKKDSLINIWNGQQINHIRKQHMLNNFMDICSSCTEWSLPEEYLLDYNLKETDLLYPKS